MAPPATPFPLTSTPRFFIDKLNNEGRERRVPLRKPPLSYVNPAMLMLDYKPRKDLSSTVSSNILSLPTSSNIVFQEPSLDHTLRPLSGSPIRVTSQSRDQFGPLLSQTYQRYGDESLVSTMAPDPSEQMSSAQPKRDQRVTQQNDALAEFSQVFDMQMNETTEEAEARLSRKRKCNFFRVTPANAGTRNLQASFDNLPATSEFQTSSEAQEASTALDFQNAAQVRHDRSSYYAVKTRSDDSKTFVKVPPGAFSDHQSQQEATSKPSAEHEPGDGEEDKPGNTRVRKAKQPLLANLVKQMMFVSGEQTEPSAETTWMIEEIVREQVVEMLKEATALANRRGSKSIAIVDLIFQIRHNTAKVSRLKTFLSWKDVRKNVKDSDDKAGGADDVPDLEDGALPGANPSQPQKASTNKKAKLVLPWEVQSYYNETVPEREDEEDEEEEEQNEATLARLASADERTKNMTREEYVYWSDCRQASFTFRKGKRFREWAGFGTIIDSKPNDDVVDILGFLTFEIVQTLTEEALKVKAAEDLANKKASGSRVDNETSKKRKREGCTLFEMPEEGRTPVEPKHVREAFRRLQIVPNKYKFMRQGFAGVRTPLRMI